MFQKDQPVFIGWAPDRQCSSENRHCRLRVGTIVDGPHYDMPGIRSPSWRVDVDGHICIAHESILTPFDNPDTETETTEQQAVEA